MMEMDLETQYIQFLRAESNTIELFVVHVCSLKLICLTFNVVCDPSSGSVIKHVIPSLSVINQKK